jgi:hypothetical protein
MTSPVEPIQRYDVISSVPIFQISPAKTLQVLTVGQLAMLGPRRPCPNPSTLQASPPPICMAVWSRWIQKVSATVNASSEP